MKSEKGNSSGNIVSQGPHSYILLMGCSRVLWGSEILAKRKLFGSMKGAESFLGHDKNTGIFLVLFISSCQQ